MEDMSNALWVRVGGEHRSGQCRLAIARRLQCSALLYNRIEERLKQLGERMYEIS